MKHLLAAALVLAPIAGCAETQAPTPPPYRDQRSVTTRFASPEGKDASVVVRVCQLQGPPGPVIVGQDPVPPDAKLVNSVECVANFGTPFYCTVGLPEQRYELGGRVFRATDETCRVEVGYANHGRVDHVSVTNNVMLPIGETRVLMGCTNGLILTLALEPVGKSPTTRASHP